MENVKAYDGLSPETAITIVWTSPGSYPDLHRARVKRLATEWPELARHIHRLAEREATFLQDQAAGAAIDQETLFE